MSFPNKIPRAVGWPNTTIIEWMRKRAIESGLDASKIKDEPIAIWRPKTVIERTGLGRTSIWRGVRDGQFPAPMVLRTTEQKS